MTRILQRVAYLACIVAVVGLSVSARADQKQKGFVPLGNGRDMSNFELVEGSDSTWKVDGDVIKCSGKPNGYFATKQSYRNFVLRFDFRYARPAELKDDSEFRGNSGYLIYITGEHKVWPQCIEVQGMNRGAGKIFAIGGASRVPAKDDPEARKRALKRVGEWNSMEIISKEGAITATLNGTKVCNSEAGKLNEGQIGFQSEGAEIHFRRLRIREL